MYSHISVLNQVFLDPIFDAAARLILGHSGLEKILLFPQEDHFIKPGKWVHFQCPRPRKDKRGQVAINIQMLIKSTPAQGLLRRFLVAKLQAQSSG
jgi:hypothetical protein